MNEAAECKRCPGGYKQECPGGYKQESPVVIRTRFHSQFVSIQDLQMQLHRDARLATDEGVEDYIQQLIDRLDKLKS